MKSLVGLILIALLFAGCEHEQAQSRAQAQLQQLQAQLEAQIRAQQEYINNRLNGIQNDMQSLRSDVGDAFGGLKTAIIVLTLFVIFIFAVIITWVAWAHKRLELMQQAMVQLYLDTGRAPPIQYREVPLLPSVRKQK